MHSSLTLDVCPQVNVLLRAEIFCYRDAIKVLANLTVVYRRDVKEQDKAHEDKEGRQEADPQQDQLPLPVKHTEGDERHDGVGEEEPEDEAEQVGVVVDPGQEAGEEEDGRDPDQLEDGHLGVLEGRPLVDDLDNAAGQEAKVGPGGTNLKVRTNVQLSVWRSYY